MLGTLDSLSYRLSMGASVGTAPFSSCLSQADQNHVEGGDLGILPPPYIPPGDCQAGDPSLLPSSLSLPRHELETALGDDRDSVRPIRVWPQFSWSVGPVGAGSLCCRLGMGEFYSNLLLREEKRDRSWSRGRSCMDCVRLQNENSLGQDPCLISSMLDAECRGIGECTYCDLRAGLF